MGVREYARILRPANIRRSWSSAWNACCAVFVGQFYPNSLRAQQATVEALAVALERLAGVEKQSATISQAFAAALASQAESSRQIALLARRLEETVTLIREETVQQVGEARRETSALLQATQSALGGQTERAVTGLRAHLDEALALARSETSGLMEATQSALGGQTERAVTGLRAHLDEALALARSETSGLMEAAQAVLGGKTESTVQQLRAHLDEGLALTRQQGEEQISASSQTLLRQQQEDFGQLHRALNDTQARVARCRQFPFASERELPDQNTPEESLIAFLFPMLQNRAAIDIGAHRGRFSRFLLDTGFSEVYAVEPHPHLFQDLAKLAKRQRHLRAIHCAVGTKDGRTPLYLAEPVNGTAVNTDLLLLSTIKPHPMPKELTFRKSIQVPLRSFTSLLRKGEVPREAGLLKIDTEGNDAVILRQIPTGAPYEALLTEFWGKKFIFHDPRARQARGTGASLADYPFTLSLARDANGSLSFTANKPPADQATWGNTFHFHNRDLFQAAYQFVQNMMPEAI
jgi:FkbM family methyltransferase